jgi:CCR4-NOT transcription complex subunit 2
MSVGPGGRPDAESFNLITDSAAPRSQTVDSGSQSNGEGQGPEAEDPLAHMSEIDKWGLKGFSFMMNNFPDYASLVAGQDLSTLGFDLNSAE